MSLLDDFFQYVSKGSGRRTSTPEDTPPPGYGSVYSAYTGEGGGERKTTALQPPTQPTTQQGTTGQQALTLPAPQSLSGIQQAMPYVSITGTLARAGQRATSTGYRGERPGMSFVEGSGYVPTYGNYHGDITGAGEMYGVESYLPPEESALSEGLGYLGEAASYAGAAYNAYRIAQGEGTPVGEAQLAATAASKVFPAISPYASYAAYYQMGAAAGSLAEQQGEAGGKIAGYPTEPLMAAPMSGGRILGSVIGGEADINAEELSYEQSAPERWLLGKEEWNKEKTATSMNPALDPINIGASVLTGKDSALSQTTAALANPVGAVAKDLVQGELFGSPGSFLTGGLNIFGGGGRYEGVGEMYSRIPTLSQAQQIAGGQNPDNLGVFGSESLMSPDYIYLKEHPEKIPAEVWSYNNAQYSQWFKQQLQSDPELVKWYNNTRKITDPAWEAYQSAISASDAGGGFALGNSYGFYDDIVGAPYKAPAPTRATSTADEWTQWA